MALTGTLLADFSAFVNESAKATSAVKGMESGADTAAAKLSKLPAAAEDSAKAFGGLSDQIAATFTGMVSADAVVGAVSESFRVLTAFVNESVAAYSKHDHATVKLTAALRQHGLATPEVISQYNALATTFQNTTKYADEDIQAMESLLTLVGNVMPSQMQAALTASTDLASGLGITLEQATLLVAKAAEGHTTALGQCMASRSTRPTSVPAAWPRCSMSSTTSSAGRPRRRSRPIRAASPRRPTPGTT